MKEFALELAAKQEGLSAKLNTMREYVQAYTLKILNDAGFFRYSAFLGGTALRFLYDLPRFSEDLDFSLEQKEKEYSFVNLIEKIKSEFVLAGYKISVSFNDQKTVHSAFLKFEELLYEARISPLKSQKFSIKIDIDTNPPKGAITKKDIINKYFPIMFLSYDLSSLFAGKLHAVFSRKYTKGRDFFDIGWYLSKWKGLAPNFALLKNSLTQTGYSGEFPNEQNWRDCLYKAIENTDWNKVKKDIENFLETQKDLEVFSKENILLLVKTTS
ncbi:MAG: nucleotidyl transferase AbiEii/AbiGii toxin family protein [Candidatus Omnitrophota bacterium]